MSTGGRTTAEDRYRRRKATVVIVVVVIALVGWFGAVAALAGGGSSPGGSESAGNQGSGRDQASANASSETTDEEEDESSGESTAQTSSGEQGEDPEDGEAPEGGQTDPQQAVADGQETEEVFDPLKEDSAANGPAAGKSEGSSAQPEGSTDSRKPEPGELSDTDRTRAKAASERYIVAAYGYTGESEDDYLEGIEQAASLKVYDSPGGEKLRDYSRAAPECGMRSTAILADFEVLGKSAEGLDVSASFSVEDGEGQAHQFVQDQRLTSSEASGGAYEVSGVSVEELTSETTPTESCPGAGSGKETADGETGPEPEPDGPSPTDKDRAKAAADRFVTAAYGYTGEDGGEYREGIARTASTPQLYRSPSGERLRQYAASAEKDGITAAAVMESFEITETEGSRIEGTARFRVGGAYDRYGGLQGESTPFKQRLTLSPVRSAYEVSRAGVERETSRQEASKQEASEREVSGRETAGGQEKKTR